MLSAKLFSNNSAAKVLLVCLTSFGAVFQAQNAHAAENKAYWCSALGKVSGETVEFYSDVFVAPFEVTKYGNAWSAYLRSNYDDVSVYGCRYPIADSDDERQARTDRDEDASEKKADGHRIIMTHWTY